MKNLLKMMMLFVALLGAQQMNAQTKDVMTKNADGTYVINTKTLTPKVIGYRGATPLTIYVKNDKVEKIEAQKNQETPKYFALIKKELLSKWNGKKVNKAIKMKVDRIVTIAYIALVRISRTLTNGSGENEICWVPLDEVKTLAFDHNIILADAIDVVRRHAEADPSYLFNLLPQKFTILQLRTLYERVYGKPQDVRNFQKKVNQLDYVVALDGREQGVAHRAARLYRFDRKLFKRVRR